MYIYIYIYIYIYNIYIYIYTETPTTWERTNSKRNKHVTIIWVWVVEAAASTSQTHKLAHEDRLHCSHRCSSEDSSILRQSQSDWYLHIINYCCPSTMLTAYCKLTSALFSAGKSPLRLWNCSFSTTRIYWWFQRTAPFLGSQKHR